MNNISSEDRVVLQQIAERLIGSYITAVEQGGIEDAAMNSGHWILNTDHWEYDCLDGEEILAILGLGEEAREHFIQEVRESLSEDSDNEDSEEFDDYDE